MESGRVPPPAAGDAFSDDDDDELVESQHLAQWLEAEPGRHSSLPQAEAAGACDSVWMADKAGMAGVDKERIRALVEQLTAGSAFGQEQARRDAETGKKVAALQERLRSVSSHELLTAQRAVGARVASLEAERDLSRVWLVVDADAFYASCEERDNPSLKTQPMGVGGMGACAGRKLRATLDPGRLFLSPGMLTTANYVARTFGVRSAMPGWIAKRLCPQLVLVPPNFERYEEAARQMREVFAHFDPRFSAGSLDEASLDITDHCARTGQSGLEAAEELRAGVFEATAGLTCSVGVAANRMLAKIASDINKPNGVCIVPCGSHEEVLAFTAPLPLRKLPGVGRVLERLLAAAGCTTCGDVLRRAPQLSLVLGVASFSHVLESAMGLGSTHHAPPPAEGEVARRGLGVERTFGDCNDPAELTAKLTEIAEALSGHLAAEGLRCRQITLKVKTTDFVVFQRQRALPGGFTNAAADILSVAVRLLKEELPLNVRLLGLRASAFEERVPLPPGQLVLPFNPKGDGEALALPCPRCDLSFNSEAELAVHSDWHVARDVQQRVRADDRRDAAAAAAASTPTRGGGANSTPTRGGGGKAGKRTARDDSKAAPITSFFAKK